MNDVTTQLEIQVAALTEQLRDARTLVDHQRESIQNMVDRVYEAERDAETLRQTLNERDTERSNDKWWSGNAESMARLLSDFFNGMTKEQAKKRLCGKMWKTTALPERAFESLWALRASYVAAYDKVHEGRYYSSPFSKTPKLTDADQPPLPDTPKD